MQSLKMKQKIDYIVFYVTCRELFALPLSCDSRQFNK